MNAYKSVLFAAAAIAGALTGSAPPARAEIIFGGFNGTVQNVDAALASLFSPGDALIGAFTYDSDGHVDVVSLPTVGVFSSISPGLLTLDFSAGSFAPPTLTGGGQLRTSHFPGVVSRFGTTTENLDSQPVFGGFKLINFVFDFEDPTGTQTTSDAVPLTFAYTSGNFDFAFRDIATNSVFPHVIGTIFLASAAPVPEPSTLVLAAAATLIVLARRRQRPSRGMKPRCIHLSTARLVRGCTTIAALAASFSLSSARFTEAAQVKLSFAGNLTVRDAVLAPYFSAGDAFEGTVTFHTSGITDSNPDPGFGEYSAITSSTIKVGGLDFSASSGTVGVLNNVFGGTWDEVSFYPTGPFTGTTQVGDFSIKEFPRIRLISQVGGTAISDTLLSTAASALPSQFRYHYFLIEFENRLGDTGGIAMNQSGTAFFTRYEISSVPESSSFTLAAGGCGLVVASYWRRRHRGNRPARFLCS